ncbi:MAG: 5'-deoxyadenosine deaminase [Acidobacteria bacterium]|nr:5'-deoxyadenosine deaminase [Acidobacteriota bacterium]
MSSILIRGGTILTMNDAMDVFIGDVSVRDGRIAAIGGGIEGPHDRTVDASGSLVLPGFIQTHVHLCQTLFRGYADDLALIDWLRLRVWPMEAAHTPASLRASARLAACELLLTGTTTALTMETVHDTDVVFDAIAGTGLRATIGKCMMDADAQVPRRLLEDTQASIDDSLDIQRRWTGAANGRLSAAFAPRFAVSCSRALLEAVASLSASADVLVHTHASEQQEEVRIVERLTGRRNLEYFADIGLTSPRLCLAHCIWVDPHEQALMAEHDCKVLHCPGSNLKLGSGLAPIPELRARGICVSLGADGAACNNRLDMFEEMRLAAVIQAVRNGPGALPARDVVWMATREGARALRLQADIGSIEVGKRADLIVVDVSRLHTTPGPDPYSTLVYAARGTDVSTTIVDGQMLVSDFALAHLDPVEIAAEARTEARALALRAGI